MRPLAIDPARLRYRALIGTGGIGWGMFFALNGNHTLDVRRAAVAVCWIAKITASSI